jgi:hypothetical protein
MVAFMEAPDSNIGHVNCSLEGLVRFLSFSKRMLGMEIKKAKEIKTATSEGDFKNETTCLWGHAVA